MSELSCPKCDGVGFDYGGRVPVQARTMTVHTCWDCGLEFAVEVDE